MDSTNFLLSYLNIYTLKLDFSPDIAQAVPGHTLVCPEVLASNLIYLQNHLLSVAVLIDVFRAKSPTRVDWHLPVFCPQFDPVVDRAWRGLNFAFQCCAAPRYCAHQVLPRM